MGSRFRSRGCRTCVARHLKCDQTQPTCLRCKRADIECRGYRYWDPFIDESQQVRERVTRSSAVASLARVPNNRHDMLRSGQGRSQVDRLASENSPPPELSFVAFRDDIFIGHLLQRLFLDHEGGCNVGRIGYKPWLVNAMNENRTDRNAILALAFAFFGKMHIQKDTIDRGAGFYGKALTGLRTDLLGKNCWSERALTTTLILYIYELIAFTSSQGWVSHVSGLARLIEIRGPRRHQDPVSLALFQASRPIIIVEALKFRKRTFLERPEWKSVPWELAPEVKDSSQYLEDIFADLPGMVHDLDNCKALDISVESSETIGRMKEKLRASLLDHLRQLVEWRWNFERTNPSIAQEIPATLLTDGRNSTPLFPTVFHFADLLIANTIMLYNTVMLCLLRMSSYALDSPFTISMLPFLADLPERTNPLNLPGRDPVEIIPSVREVCRSLEHRILAVTSSAVAFPVLLPLCVALSCLHPQSKEAEWLVRLAGVIEKSSGFEVKSLLDMASVPGKRVSDC